MFLNLYQSYGRRWHNFCIIRFPRYCIFTRYDSHFKNCYWNIKIYMGNQFTNMTRSYLKTSYKRLKHAKLLVRESRHGWIFLRISLKNSSAATILPQQDQTHLNTLLSWAIIWPSSRDDNVLSSEPGVQRVWSGQLDLMLTAQPAILPACRVTAH